MRDKIFEALWNRAETAYKKGTSESIVVLTEDKFSDLIEDLVKVFDGGDRDNNIYLFSISRAIRFKLIDGKYLDSFNNEITTEMIMAYKHEIYHDNGIIWLDQLNTKGIEIYKDSIELRELISDFIKWYSDPVFPQKTIEYQVDSFIKRK